MILVRNCARQVWNFNGLGCFVQRKLTETVPAENHQPPITGHWALVLRVDFLLPLFWRLARLVSNHFLAHKEPDMQLNINGVAQEHPEGLTVAGLLVALEKNPLLVAVEVNRDLVTRSRHAEVELHDGDTLEIVTLAGGG